MQRIGILEDSKNLLLDYEVFINDLFRKYNWLGGIVLLTPDYNELMQELDSGTINVCIIDINLRNDDQNGMSIAEQIREKSYEVEIIFVTGCLEFASQAFDVRAYQFVAKPGWRKLEATLLKLYKEKELYKQKYFKLNFKKEICFIPISNVVYLESLDRKTIIHTLKNSTQKEYETYLSLEKLISKVKEGYFTRAHRGIFVNLLFVESVNRTDKFITFVDGSTCVVSPNYISNFVIDEGTDKNEFRIFDNK